MTRVAAFAAVLVMLSGCGEASTKKQRGPHWNDKAIWSARSAERRVGGFNSSDRAAYRNGLQHILNAHDKIGSFTIAQVIDDENRRENERASAAARARNQAVARAKAAAAQRAAAEEAHIIHGRPECLTIDRRTVHAVSAEYSWSIVGKLVNHCERDFGYAQVEFGFYDAAGNKESSGFVNINNLSAGETWAFKKSVYENVSEGGKWDIEGISAF